MARSPSGRRSTIYDIAAATKASPSTVSLVLNGSWTRYRIKEDTAKRVLKAAQDLGYAVNMKARGLRLSRSGLAGMIIPHYRNRFFAGLAEAFETDTRQRGLCPIVVSTQRLQPLATRNSTPPIRSRRQPSSAHGGVPPTTTFGRNRRIASGPSSPCGPLAISSLSAASDPVVVSSRGKPSANDTRSRGRL